MNQKLTILCALVAIAMIAGLPVAPIFAADGHDHDHGEHAHAQEHGHETDSSADGPYEIHFKTHPEPGKIIPDKDMVELMFEVTHDGNPAEDVDLSYRVYTPPKRFWFGTDFPVVEGTQLLSGTVHLPRGSQVISMILPIRGTYRVKATARGPHGTTDSTMNFEVSENPQEVINLSVFLLVLFLVGGVGGYFLTDSSASTPRSWGVLLALGVGVLSMGTPEGALAHGQGSWDPHTLEQQKGTKTLTESVDLSVKPFPQPVDVGEMLNVRYRVDVSQEAHHEEDGHGDHGHDGMHGSEGLILAESHFVHSEGGLEMVKQSSWLENGEGEVNVQLFDGAPHYLVTRFYKPTELYKPSGRHDHGDRHGSEATSGDEHGHDEEGHGRKEHDGHSAHSKRHDQPVEPSWEAEMQYHLEPGEYTVTFQESGDPAMKWLLLPTGTEDPHVTARHAMEKCRSVQPESSFSGDTRCYNLTLNETGTTHHFTVESGGDYHLFTQHLPREFDMILKRNGEAIEPERKFITGKGEYLGRSVKWVELSAVQPPFDDIFKGMMTLLGVVGLGFLVGYKGPRWIG